MGGERGDWTAEEPTAATLDVGGSDPLPELGTTPPDLTPSSGEPRYQLLDKLGEGGMGTVWRAIDRQLERDVALKVLHPRFARSAGGLERFREEARLVARLDHPGVVPVHELGALDDGRPYFAMKRITGRTLGEVRVGSTVRARLQILLSVVQTVAFAHDRGIVHRDLKPSNVMIGAFGEVLVLDWGIAGAIGQERSSTAGTRGYMSPEQAAGRPPHPADDVYALGCLLHHLLLGRLPAGGPLDVADPTLAELAAGALAPSPADRIEAGALAAGLTRWLEGVAQRERADAEVERAEELRPCFIAASDEARRLRADGEALLAQLDVAAPDEDRLEGWSLLDRARELELEAEHDRSRYLQILQGALTLDPESPGAHARLAAWWRQRHAEAEASDDAFAAQRALPFIRAHDRDGAHRDYLRGTGKLSLRAAPEARVTLFRYEEQGRRLVPTHPESLGTTPHVDVELPIGSYLAVLEHQARPALRLPFRVRRLEHEEGRDPDGEPRPVRLLTPAEVGDDCPVPAGWFEAGTGPPTSYPIERQRLWCEGFLMARHPVTNAEYARFLDHLRRDGRVAEAEEHVPRLADGAAAYPLQDDRYHVGVDPDGHRWLPDGAVICVTWASARAYARWRAEQDGLPWRLPFELEWQKAARGADYRPYPWGHHIEVTWARVQGSPAPPGPSSIEAFPEDVSPYGVRHLGGQAATWLLDDLETGARVEGQRVVTTPIADEDVAFRCVAGGSWRTSPKFCRADVRRAFAPSSRSEAVGIRLVRPWPC